MDEDDQDIDSYDGEEDAELSEAMRAQLERFARSHRLAAEAELLPRRVRRIRRELEDRAEERRLRNEFDACL